MTDHVTLDELARAPDWTETDLFKYLKERNPEVQIHRATLPVCETCTCENEDTGKLVWSKSCSACNGTGIGKPL